MFAKMPSRVPVESQKVKVQKNFEEAMSSLPSLLSLDVQVDGANVLTEREGCFVESTPTDLLTAGLSISRTLIQARTISPGKSNPLEIEEATPEAPLEENAGGEDVPNAAHVKYVETNASTL